MQTHSNEETIRFPISSPQSGRGKVHNTYDINHIKFTMVVIDVMICV